MKQFWVFTYCRQKTQLLHIIFTEPGKVILAVPCIPLGPCKLRDGALTQIFRLFRPSFPCKLHMSRFFRMQWRHPTSTAELEALLLRKTGSTIATLADSGGARLFVTIFLVAENWIRTGCSAEWKDGGGVRFGP